MAQTDVSLKVEDTDDPGAWTVSGREGITPFYLDRHVVKDMSYQYHV